VPVLPSLRLFSARQRGGSRKSRPWQIRQGCWPSCDDPAPIGTFAAIRGFVIHEGLNELDQSSIKYSRAAFAKLAEIGATLPGLSRTVRPAGSPTRLESRRVPQLFHPAGRAG